MVISPPRPSSRKRGPRVRNSAGSLLESRMGGTERSKIASQESETPMKGHGSRGVDADIVRRKLNSSFLFWSVCPDKPCRRTRSCRGDVQACFARCWPFVPEENKILLRAYITACGRGLPAREALRAANAELVQMRELEARPQPPAKSSTPAMIAPSVCANAETPNPRVRQILPGFPRARD